MQAALRFRPAVLLTTFLASLAGCAAEVPEGENEDVAADDVFGSTSKLVPGVYDAGSGPAPSNTILVYKGTFGGVRVALAGPGVRAADASVSVRGGRSFISYQASPDAKKVDLELVQTGDSVEVVGEELLQGTYTRRDGRKGAASLLGKYQGVSPTGASAEGERLEFVKGLGEEVSYTVTTQGKTFTGTATMRPENMSPHTQLLWTTLGACKVGFEVRPRANGYFVQFANADKSSGCSLKTAVVPYTKVP